jgi:hypothetical protein
MIISTKSIKPIKWQTVDFEIAGIIADQFRLCTISQELGERNRPTGRWLIRYSLQNENGKHFGYYSNSLEEAKESARNFLESFLELLTVGANR